MAVAVNNVLRPSFQTLRAPLASPRSNTQHPLASPRGEVQHGSYRSPRVPSIRRVGEQVVFRVPRHAGVQRQIEAYADRFASAQYEINKYARLGVRSGGRVDELKGERDLCLRAAKEANYEALLEAQESKENALRIQNMHRVEAKRMESEKKRELRKHRQDEDRLYDGYGNRIYGFFA
eukprot:TRINITY_DN27849_c0_g1_i1.p1 TRINITY_DN27849_c0_g1~~TRINITY_DN27849_c0_g1_i1.p1  ORF type:complete len:178 (+),score=27.68 TRINITY_DN27849_c0_g1_i1:85-618(+)